jgi:hypothetical protein
MQALVDSLTAGLHLDASHRSAANDLTLGQSFLAARLERAGFSANTAVRRRGY